MIDYNAVNITDDELRMYADLTNRNEHSEAAARLAAWTYLKVRKPEHVKAAAWLMNELRRIWHDHEDRGHITIDEHNCRCELFDRLLDLIGRALGINTQKAIAAAM